MYPDDIHFNNKEVDLFLKVYFTYYNTLEDTDKRRFVSRVIHFAQNKNFVGKKGFSPNNKVKAIISASAVQLTLGLDKWDIPYFDTILLFPGDFFNNYSELGLKGETDLRGFMSFSWTSFITGYKIPNDNLNLGLHEFTHALRFNGIRGEETDYFFENYFAKWYNFAKKEFLRVKAGKQSIFRKYGGSNINEFLSVVVEHFFESPVQFQKEHPLLYSATAILLNQKTNGLKTNLNVRWEEVLKTSATNSLSVNIPEPFILKNNSLVTSLIFFSTAVISFLRTTALDFPALFLFAVACACFLVFDYTYGRALVREDKIILKKGYLFFKNRKSFSVPGNRLVKAQIFSTGINEQTIIFTFFDEKGVFSEASIRAGLSKTAQENLVTELEKNFVWILENR